MTIKNKIKYSALALCSLAVMTTSLAQNANASDGYVPANEIGVDQNVYIKIEPLEAGRANCRFINKAESNVIFAAPAYINLKKSSGALDIVCLSTNGKWGGRMQLRAKFDGSFPSILNLPFAGLEVANYVLNDFDEPFSTSIATTVKYPNVITVQLKSLVDVIPNAKFGTEEDAIANAPVPVQTTQQAKPVQHKKVKHKKARKVYHTGESNS